MYWNVTQGVDSFFCIALVHAEEVPYRRHVCNWRRRARRVYSGLSNFIVPHRAQNTHIGSVARLVGFLPNLANVIMTSLIGSVNEDFRANHKNWKKCEISADPIKPIRSAESLFTIPFRLFLSFTDNPLNQQINENVRKLSVNDW